MRKTQTPDILAGDPSADASRPRDRRSSHRAAIDIPAVMHLDEEQFPCTIVDLSVEGLSLSHSGSVAPDSAVRVGFRLPNSRQPLEIAGVVLRRVPGPRSATLGIRFIAPSDSVVRVIKTFVARNRTDLPFSRTERRNAAGAAESVPTARDDDLQALYARAVAKEEGESRDRRGFLSRWRKRRS